MNTTLISTQPPFPSHIAQLATEGDLTSLCANLRPECSEECLAATGLTALDSLKVDLPRTSIIRGDDARPLAALMVGPAGAGDAALWVAVSSEVALRRNARILVERVATAVLALHRAGYDNIHSLVDARNVTTAVLLRDAGFAFIQRFEEFGVEGLPFGLYTSKIKCSAGEKH